MAMFKEVYGTSLNDVVPASSVLYDLIKFDDSSLLGDSYRQSVTLSNEHGFSYCGSAAAATTLEAAIPANIIEANHSGFEMVGRVRITYAAASRGNSSKQAFARTWGTALKNLRAASMKRLELSLLMGQDGIAQAAAATALSTETLTLADPAGLSVSILAGLEGAKLEAWTSRAASSTEHGLATGSTVASVSLANGTITSGTGEFSGGTTVDEDDFLYFYGARTSSAYNEMVGLRKIVANSGTLFGINSATYNLWAGNTSTTFGQPSMGKFLDAVTKMVEKGLDEKVVLLVCPKTWEVLNSDLAAQRRFDGTYSKSRAPNGAQAITYFGQTGEIEVRVHPFLFRGEAMLFPLSPLKRVGSADIGMGVPGGPDGGRDVFFHDPSINAIEARSFTDQALFCEAPSKCLLVSGITYA